MSMSTTSVSPVSVFCCNIPLIGTIPTNLWRNPMSAEIFKTRLLLAWLAASSLLSAANQTVFLAPPPLCSSCLRSHIWNERRVYRSEVYWHLRNLANITLESIDPPRRGLKKTKQNWRFFLVFLILAILSFSFDGSDYEGKLVGLPPFSLHAINID